MITSARIEALRELNDDRHRTDFGWIARARRSPARRRGAWVVRRGSPRSPPTRRAADRLPHPAGRRRPQRESAAAPTLLDRIAARRPAGRRRQIGVAVGRSSTTQVGSPTLTDTSLPRTPPARSPPKPPWTASTCSPGARRPTRRRRGVTGYKTCQHRTRLRIITTTSTAPHPPPPRRPAAPTCIACPLPHLHRAKPAPRLHR